MQPERDLSVDGYRDLAEFRRQIRSFLHFSETTAKEHGIEMQQHQLMLTVHGLPEGVKPTISEIASRLFIQHHSAVELVNRLAAGGYVKRRRAGEDRREVLLSLTPKGEKILRTLSLHHKDELRMQGPALVAALKQAMQVGKRSDGIPAKTSSTGRK